MGGVDGGKGDTLFDAAIVHAKKYLELEDFHRFSLYVAHFFFKEQGGTKGYILGDEKLLWEMAQTWDLHVSLLELPEYQRPLTTEDYRRLNGGK